MAQKLQQRMVKELRDKTGVGMMDAKRALVEVDGDMEKAVDHLRETGMAKAAKKGDRIAQRRFSERLCSRKCCKETVEINSETDFVAKMINLKI